MCIWKSLISNQSKFHLRLKKQSKAVSAFMQLVHLCIKLSADKKMKLAEIASILNANIICGSCSADDDVKYAFSSDLMSDVLTLDVEDMLLITGLANVQTIRTAEMADIKYIVFVRNKKATEEILELAIENNMVILESPFSLFRASGLLFNAGLEPIY